MNNSTVTTGWDFFGVPMPLILKDKTIMDAGVWNGYIYDNTVVSKIFNNTDWADEDNRALYLDHNDGNINEKTMQRKASEWIGRVINEKILPNGKAVGDLEIHDPIIASKIYYGKPKVGVSPRMEAQLSGNTVTDGYFKNYSIVINPAVKTAYINNSQYEMDEIEFAQITAMEEKRKQLGMSVEKFYAIPRDPPSASKLPIFDEAHARNALARFNQISGVSEEEKTKALNKIKSVAKKYGIEISEKNNNEVDKMADEINEDNKGENTEPVKEKIETKNLSDEDLKKISDSVTENLKNINKDSIPENNEPKEQANTTPEPPEKVEESKEMNEKINNITKELSEIKDENKKLNEKLNEPAKISVPTATAKTQVQEFQDVDEGMVAYLSEMRKTNTCEV